VSYSKAQIDAFMLRGDPREKFFLRWDGKDSFFDDQVQRLLLQFHPGNGVAQTFPIDAWSIADSVCSFPSLQAWTELFPCMERLPLWTAELLAAIMQFRQREADRMKKPLTALDEIKAWVGDRYLWQTSNDQYTHEQVVRNRVQVSRGEEAVSKLSQKRQNMLGAAPLSVHEAIMPPTDSTGRIDGAGKLSAAAYRQADRNEGIRRDKIMRHWAQSWLAHLGVTETA